MVEEIARTGADHISIVTLWGMADIRSSLIEPHPDETPKDDVVRGVIRVAKSNGLKVMLFPISGSISVRLASGVASLHPANRKDGGDHIDGTYCILPVSRLRKMSRCSVLAAS